MSVLPRMKGQEKQLNEVETGKLPGKLTFGLHKG